MDRKRTSVLSFTIFMPFLAAILRLVFQKLVFHFWIIHVFAYPLKTFFRYTAAFDELKGSLRQLHAKENVIFLNF